MTDALRTQALALFPFLADAGLDDLAFVRLPEGQYVARQGQRCSQFALILSGSLRVYQLSENGREVTLFHVHAGESCILSASSILSEAPFPASAVTESEVLALMVEATVLRKRVAEREAWRTYVFGLLAQRMSSVMLLLEDVAFGRLDQRLARHLLANGGASGTVRSTHQTIATELGTSREVISRVLKDFEKQGRISLGRGRIDIVNLDGLVLPARVT